MVWAMRGRGLPAEKARGTGLAKVGAGVREREESKNFLRFWPEQQGRHRLGEEA